MEDWWKFSIEMFDLHMVSEPWSSWSLLDLKSWYIVLQYVKYCWYTLQFLMIWVLFWWLFRSVWIYSCLGIFFILSCSLFFEIWNHLIISHILSEYEFYFHLDLLLFVLDLRSDFYACWFKSLWSEFVDVVLIFVDVV